MSRSETFLSPETLREIQARFPEDDHVPNLPFGQGGKVPHGFTMTSYRVYKSRWSEKSGSLKDGWD